jgi:hypothetical protein
MSTSVERLFQHPSLPSVRRWCKPRCGDCHVRRQQTARTAPLPPPCRPGCRRNRMLRVLRGALPPPPPLLTPLLPSQAPRLSP